MGPDEQSGSALPVRTVRSRRSGRHSSPHQLSVPPEAPGLVIAVPGAATTAGGELAAAIIADASASCPGIPVRTGYLAGGDDRLQTVLRDMHDRGGRPAVVVPLLTGPDSAITEAIGAIAARAGFPALVSGPLGPHPLLAEALHARLAEAGLAHATRAGRVSIVAEADGILVGAAGADAVQAAGVVAVLLASRLAIPVASAALTDADSLREALGRLGAAKVAHVALAPCVVGPEIGPGVLERLTAATGMAAAQPIGAHAAIGKLIAMRYGAALEDPRLAGMVG